MKIAILIWFCIDYHHLACDIYDEHATYLYSQALPWEYHDGISDNPPRLNDDAPVPANRTLCVHALYQTRVFLISVAVVRPEEEVGDDEEEGGEDK